MANGRSTLSFLTLALIASPVFGQMTSPRSEALASVRAQEPSRVMASANHLAGLRSALGLNELHTFAARNTHTDEVGATHVHFQQNYQGIPVWGGMAITHQDRAGNHAELTDALVRNVNVNVVPNLTGAEAVAVAHANLNPLGAYAVAPTSELIIYPVQTLAPKAGLARHANAVDFENQVLRTVLAYHVHTSLRNDNETKDTDYIIDANTGAILKTWNDLHTTAAVGTGISQFSGTVSINTNLNGSTYELKDIARSMNISTYNMNHATSGTGTLYTDADNSWGDGNNYTGSTTSTTGATGQTAAVDAHYGIEMTFDFYNQYFGRNGIDGAGKATYSKVHYSTSYDNAFWDDTCFCMTYGDGSSFKSLEAPDVAGHEMSHGVCANTANLNYSGESGGLNESNSDIFGNMVELYDHNGKTLPATVANTDGAWTVGEQLSTTPLRYMYKPSKDGSSPDYWTSSVGNLDVHYSSGPGNHMFFFLSQGASATTGNYSSTYAPSGFAGIGPEKAVRIQYKALTTYMTSTTNYAAYRTAMMNAASALYGTTGAEYAAVQNAFGAINVGALAPAGVTIAISPTTATVPAGSTKQFTATVAGTTNTAVTWTATGGTISTAGLYTAPATAGTYTVKVTSSADTTKTASATVTVTAPVALAISTNPASQTVTAGSNASFTVAATGGTAPYSYQWYKNGTAISGATAATYTFTTAVADSGSTFYAKVTDSASTPASVTSTTATLTVNPVSTTVFNEVESNNTIATANVVAPTFTSIVGNLPTTTDVDYFALTLAAGQKLTLNMTGPTGPDWDLYLKNSAGTTLASSTGSTTTESLTYTNSGTSPITVYANVTCYATASTSNYTLVPTYSAVTQTVAVAITPTSTTVNPGATAQFTATVTGTTNTAVTWTTTGGTISTSGLFTAPTTSGTYTVKATSVADTTKSASATVTVGTVSTTYNEVESNNTIATANAVPATATKIVGYIGSSTDNDYFAVTVAAGRTLAVGMTGPTGSTYDYDLYLYNAAGTQLAASEGSTTTENVSYTNSGTAAVTYYIAVKRYAGSSTTTPYNLTISR